jgi:MraZ protein
MPLKLRAAGPERREGRRPGRAGAGDRRDEAMVEPNYIFTGRHEHTIDEKGRLALPTSLRDELRKSINPDRIFLGYYPGTSHLSLYPAERWQILVEDWRDESRFPGTKIMLDAQRLFFANLEPVGLDRLGRILIPMALRSRAGLGREVVIIGTGVKMEVWDPEALRLNEERTMESWKLALEAEAANAAAAPRLPAW